MYFKQEKYTTKKCPLAIKINITCIVKKQLTLPSVSDKMIIHKYIYMFFCYFLLFVRG